MSQFTSKGLKRKLDLESDSDEPTSSKEMKTATVSPSADGMGIFNRLNQDVFEEIVNFLSKKEILYLCLTSKTMNQYIGNNEQIMKRITLTFPKLYRVRDISHSQRTYRKVVMTHRIRNSDLPKVLPFIEKISSNVKDFKLSQIRSYSAAANIIKQFKSATTIHADFDYIARNTVKQVLVPQLKVLNFNGSGIALGLFENCQLLEKLSIDGRICYEQNDPLLQQFLIKQTQLKSLHIKNGFHLFKDNVLATDSKFKLKELGISIWYRITPEAKINLQNFLNLHRSTLEKLTFDDSVILEMFRDFPKLKSVVLDPGAYIWRNTSFVLQEMPYVEVLYVTKQYMPYGSMELSIENLRNLKEFRGKNQNFRSPLNHVSINKLFLDSCIIPNINMPNLLSAKFNNVTFPPNMQLNDNIQELSLNNCKNADNLLSFIEHPGVNLKLLEISNMKLLNRRVYANEHKIQKLIIKNVAFLS